MTRLAEIPAREIDIIFDRAVDLIQEGVVAFSCNALRPLNGESRASCFSCSVYPYPINRVLDFYRETFEVDLPPAPCPSEFNSDMGDRFLYAVVLFAVRRKVWPEWTENHYEKLTSRQKERAQSLRVFMLSLIRVAWRDLV